MLTSQIHEYRGHFVKISCSRSFPLEKYSGGYLVTNSSGANIGSGHTPIVPNGALAQQLALSLALRAIDCALRGAKT